MFSMQTKQKYKKIYNNDLGNIPKVGMFLIKINNFLMLVFRNLTYCNVD